MLIFAIQGGDNQLGAFDDDIIHALANRIDKFADRVTQLVFQFFGRSADHSVEDQPLLSSETEYVELVYLVRAYLVRFWF